VIQFDTHHHVRLAVQAGRFAAGSNQRVSTLDAAATENQSGSVFSVTLWLPCLTPRRDLIGSI